MESIGRAARKGKQGIPHTPYQTQIRDVVRSGARPAAPALNGHPAPGKRDSSPASTRQSDDAKYKPANPLRTRATPHLSLSCPDALPPTTNDQRPTTSRHRHRQHRLHPPDLAARYGIEIVPLHIIFGGRTFVDSLTDDTREFYELLAKSGDRPTTAAPSPGMFLEAITRAARRADAVLCITVSAQFSAMYDSARQAIEIAKAEAPHADIRLLDSATPPWPRASSSSKPPAPRRRRRDRRESSPARKR